MNHHDDDRLIQERLRSYRPPQCPPEVVDRILDTVEAEERSLRPAERLPRQGLGWWSRLLVPVAALGLMVFLLRPGGLTQWSDSIPPSRTNAALEQGGSSSDPCEGELEEIFRRLGIDRSEVAYDDATICAAAQEVRLAWTLMEQAMDSTERVIGRETRSRFTQVLRSSLGAGSSSAKTANHDPPNGG